MTVLTAVLVVIAGWDAERNEAATKPAAEESENNAKDPSKGTFRLVQGGNTCLSAELACDLLRLIAEMHGSGCNNDLLLGLSSERLLLHCSGSSINFIIIILNLVYLL